MTARWEVRGTPTADDLRAIAAVFERGGVILMPTDTIYGLHARANDESSILRISAMKGRDGAKPFIVLGSSLKQLEAIGARVDDRIRSALDELWPGPLTAIVPLAMPVAAARGARSLAIRVPNLEWLRDLLDLTGPLASTSANRSGEAPIESADALSNELHDGLDAVVSAGRQTGEPSTVVDFTGDEPRFIRDGERLFTQKVWKTLRKSL